eukprot:gb/GEZN01007966.1/.p1 GENE.gb/GEZN01007966.1/~~gb/GEZN01007966.1/.p1  ORF type:complete len:463 (+),score=39.08 gb/GEZN01007966.1/:134-1390(+)
MPPVPAATSSSSSFPSSYSLPLSSSSTSVPAPLNPPVTTPISTTTRREEKRKVADRFTGAASGPATGTVPKARKQTGPPPDGGSRRPTDHQESRSRGHNSKREQAKNLTIFTGGKVGGGHRDGRPCKESGEGRVHQGAEVRGPRHQSHRTQRTKQRSREDEQDHEQPPRKRLKLPNRPILPEHATEGKAEDKTGTATFKLSKHKRQRHGRGKKGRSVKIDLTKVALATVEESEEEEEAIGPLTQMRKRDKAEARNKMQVLIREGRDGQLRRQVIPGGEVLMGRLDLCRIHYCTDEFCRSKFPINLDKLTILKGCVKCLRQRPYTMEDIIDIIQLSKDPANMQTAQVSRGKEVLGLQNLLYKTLEQYNRQQDPDEVARQGVQSATRVLWSAMLGVRTFSEKDFEVWRQITNPAAGGEGT